MGYLIGIDEAGYGPNLGPLVIAASVWRVADEPLGGVDLYRRLSPMISRQSPPPQEAAPRRLVVADSKAVYSPQHGLRTLERGVLAMLGLAARQPADWHEFWDLVAPNATPDRDGLVWHEGFNPELPLEADPHELAELDAPLRAACDRAGARLCALRASVLFPERFNARTTECGSKGEALSRWTLELLAELLADCPGEPVLVVSDKHGGRNFYGRLLQRQFPEHLVEIYRESAAESIYRFGPAERRVEIRFRARGEEALQTALASMLAKYFRELAMRAFNGFWCRRVPELRATAGYPVDARRFKLAISALQNELGIADRVLWRTR